MIITTSYRGNVVQVVNSPIRAREQQRFGVAELILHADKREGRL